MALATDMDGTVAVEIGRVNCGRAIAEQELPESLDTALYLLQLNASTKQCLLPFSPRSPTLFEW
jgi:hypothetical protein